MNSGAEAVETAIKVARKWGYQVKGVPDGRATIIVAGGNFHGRTTTIVSFSTTRRPATTSARTRPGFRDRRRTATSTRCAAAIDDDTVAVLLEPIQGEAGVLVPPAGYLAGGPRAVHRRATCCSSPTRSSPGSGRTGATLAWTTRASCPTCTCWARRSAAGSCRSRRWSPTATCSACCSPASTGRTFGGNPLACAVGRAVVRLLATGEYQQRARELGAHLHDAAARAGRPRARRGPRPRAVGRASTSTRRSMTGREVCERLLAARRAGQGHPRRHHPAGPAARGRPGRAQWAVDQLAGALADAR